MGAEQSNGNRRSYQQAPPPQMSEQQVQRLLEAQRQQYERKLEEVAAIAAAQKAQEEATKAAIKRQEENAARAAAQRKQQEENAARAAAQQKQQEENAARAAAQQKQQEENAARAAAQRKQQEEAARNSAYSIERDRAPYSYSGNQLQQPAASAPRPLFSNVYPNLGPAGPSIGAFNNNPFRQTNPNQEYVFVTMDNYGHSASYNRPAPGPAPSAPTPPRRPAPRIRSESRNRNSPRERDVLDCPTCNVRYGMKIFQCEIGHSSCNDCKIRGRVCGICRRTLTNVRNFDLENHVAQLKAPCPHASEGCKLFIKIADMEDHIRECPFKEQDCPLNAVFGTCRWKGKLSQISSHFESAHPNGSQTNINSEMHLINVRNNSQQVNLIVLGSYNFLLHVKVSETDGKVYMAVQLIGTKFSAMKWLYEVHVYNKSENRRKYMYTDNCCASMDKIEDVFQAGACVVLPIWHANTFVCNGALTYKVFIKLANEEKKGFGKNQRGKGRNYVKN